MRIDIRGKRFAVEADFHRGGFDFSFGPSWIKSWFAIWWVYGTDCGIFLRPLGEWRHLFVQQHDPEPFDHFDRADESIPSDPLYGERMDSADMDEG